MTEIEKATWEFLFNTPSVSLLKRGSLYSNFVEAVTSDREKAFKAGAEWQKKQLIEKAVKWLKSNICYDENGEGNMEWVVMFMDDDEMVEDFKKFMED